MKTFKLLKYSLLYWQPVKFFQNRRNVFEFSWSNNNTCITVLNLLQLRNKMRGCTKQRAAIVYFTEAANDGFPLNKFKTLFRLSRELLDQLRCVLSGVVEFVSVWSFQGNLSLFEIIRASVLFSPKFQMQISTFTRERIFLISFSSTFLIPKILGFLSSTKNSLTWRVKCEKLYFR